MAAMRMSRCGTRRRDQPVPGADGELGLSALGYNFLGGMMAAGRGAVPRLLNPTVNSYKRINAPRNAVGRDLVAKLGDLWRQQPHPHDPRPRAGPLRAAARRRRGQSLSAAGRHPRRRPRRDGQRARSRQAARHQHVRAGRGVEGVRAGCRSTCSTRCARSTSAMLRAALGAPFVDSYVKLRMAEWQDYMSYLTDGSASAASMCNQRWLDR